MQKSKKRKYKINLKKFIPFVLIVLAVGIGIFSLVSGAFGKIESRKGKDNNKEGGEAQAQELPVVKEPVYKSLTIRCAGDIMAHTSQVESAKQADGTYDFSGYFEYVDKYFKEADLSLANVETTFSGDGKYSGYPGFDSPDNLAECIANAGIDVALFANNHMLDTKLDGAKRTVKLLRENGMTVVGAREDTSENRSAVVDVKGVKVGIVAYTYETDMVDGKRTLNGSKTSGMDGAADYINTFRYYKIDDDKKLIANQIQWCRDNGAAVVICYLHWGNEYKSAPSKNDEALARFVAESGADIIFASHPHVLQPIKLLEVGALDETTASDGSIQITSQSRIVPVFYSMGNFVSNQRYESLSGTYGADTSKKTEQGIIASVDLTVCLDDNSVVIDNVSYIPTWVDRYEGGVKYIYKIIPLVEGFENNPTLLESKHAKRASEALTAIDSLLKF